MSDLGESVPATTVDRMCASSAQTLMMAADAVRTGQRDCVIAGGVESMTRVQRDVNVSDIPGMQEQYDVDQLEMGMTTEKVAKRYDVSREEQDAYGARSQQRAVKAMEEGRFDDEIVPSRPKTARSPRTKCSAPARPPRNWPNSAGVQRGRDRPRRQRLAALRRRSGGDGLLERSGTTADDYDLVELNEAFASQTLYCQEQLSFGDGVFNVNGGAIAIGHPLGASGARLPVTLIHEMSRQNAERILSTQCVGYGQTGTIEFTLP